MEDDGTIAMVPLADMLNHKTGHNNVLSSYLLLLPSIVGAG